LEVVSQFTLLETLHVLLDVTVTVSELVVCGGFHVVLDRVRLASGGFCATETVRVGAPGAVTVMVPVLTVVPVFGVALIPKEPLPVRLAGTKFDTVNHVVALLPANHVPLDVTVTVRNSPIVWGAQAEWERFNVGVPGCVTDMVRLVTPVADTVIVPLLAALPELWAAVIVNEPFPLPLPGDAFSHDVLLLETVHALLDVTLTVVLPPVDRGFHEPVGDIVNTGAGATWFTFIVRVMPDPEIVTVPVLVVVPVLADAVILNEPLPVRFAGVTWEIVSHDWLLDGEFQVMLDVIFIVELSPDDRGFHVPECDNVRFGAAP